MSYTSHSYHIVFATKERRPLLTDALLARTIEYMHGIVRNLDGRIVAANGMSDHIHLAAVAHPSMAVADLVGTIKANSSKWLHDTVGQRDFAWQDGYASFTVSASVLPKVVQYIENQQVHHRVRTFTEELVDLLKRHGVKYDERYIGS